MKNIYGKIILLLLILLDITQIHAQNNGYESRDFVETKSKKELSNKMAIKTDVLMPLMGEFSLMLEYNFKKDFTVEIGVIYVFEHWLSPLSSIEFFEEDLYPIQPSLGGFVDFKYFMDDSPYRKQSSYLSIQYKYKKLERIKTEPLPGTTETILYDKFNSISFIMGLQIKISRRWFVDFGLGMGYSFITNQRYVLEDGSYVPVIYFIQNGLQYEDNVPVNIELNARFGYIIF